MVVVMMVVVVVVVPLCQLKQRLMLLSVGYVIG
jgi:hypothetical protein